jgi:hypothetical protein
MSPLDWICPLLAIDADAFNHGDTPEFAAISAVALRHNEISQTLSTRPDQFEPMHPRKINGDVDPRPWCQGFYAAMRLRTSAMGAVAGRQQRQPRSASAHPAALSRRSGPPIARIATQGQRDRGFSAQRLPRYLCGRRGLAPILDADPLRTRPLITADVGAHTGYRRPTPASWECRSPMKWMGTEYVAIQSGWGVDAQRIQDALATKNNIGVEDNVPQGGVVWVFALKK